MEKMNDLKDLLRHELMDLYSAEEQIIKAMPAMIKKAKNPELKQALQQHLKITEAQRTRLEKVQQLMEGGRNTESGNGGLLSRLFKRSQFCRGMQGIIEEGEKVMAEDMSPEVMDAAIIACSQKIEHYEICGYGTARAFAEELGMTDVASMLEQTLDEEYEADDRLTGLAVSRLNQRAEKGAGRTTGARSSMTAASTSSMGSRQRATREEPEMQMAASKRGTTAGRGQTATKGTGSAQTLGNARSTASDTRSSSSKSAAASVGRGGKTATKGSSANTRGTQSSGRGSSGGRGDR